MKGMTCKYLGFYLSNGRFTIEICHGNTLVATWFRASTTTMAGLVFGLASALRVNCVATSVSDGSVESLAKILNSSIHQKKSIMFKLQVAALTNRIPKQIICLSRSPQWSKEVLKQMFTHHLSFTTAESCFKAFTAVYINLRVTILESLHWMTYD